MAQERTPISVTKELSDALGRIASDTGRSKFQVANLALKAGIDMLNLNEAGYTVYASEPGASGVTHRVVLGEGIEEEGA